MEVNKIFNNKVVFDFNACCLYEANNEKNRISLTTPARDCLAIIVSNSPNTTSQQVLFDRVWEQHGIPVNVNTLYQHISMIRRAFRQLGMQDDVIVTIPRRGMSLAPGLQVAEMGGSKSIPSIEKLGQSAVLVGLASDVALQTAAEVVDKPSPEKRSFHTKWSVIINWRIIKLLALSMVLISAVSMLYFFTTQDSRFRDYQYAMNVNGCDIYLDKKMVAWSKNEVSQALAWAEKTCSRNERVYVSYFNMLPRISLISCNGDILNEKTNCASYYIYREAVRLDEK